MDIKPELGDVQIIALDKSYYNGQGLKMPARIVWPEGTFSKERLAPYLTEENLLHMLLLAQQLGADVQYDD